MKFEVLDKYNLVNFITDKSVDINYSKHSRDEIRSILQGMSDYQFKKIISPRQTHTNNVVVIKEDNEVIGNIHSGWKGTLNKILSNGINLMIKEFSSNVEDIIVCIGPSIMGCCFEVDKDVVDMFISNFDDIDEFIRLGEIKEGKQKYYIDTIGINKRELCNLGILEENIYLSNVCTKCSSDTYYSYRVHGQDSGRNVTLVCMK